tara:strand:- start:350 stop:826 length:477 start_codon:yes stop_codon:yes gene_type:complete
MATVYGVNFTKYDQSDPRKMADVAEVGARMRVQYDTYEADALGAGSTISMARMPKGARVWNVVLITDDLSGSGTLQVGDSGDPNRFITESICGDANKVHYMHPKAHASDSNVTLLGGVSGTGIDAFGYEYTSETDIIITTATASISGTINLAVFYTVD